MATAAELRQCREKLGWSQARLGEVLHLTRTFVAQMERGRYDAARCTELSVR